MPAPSRAIKADGRTVGRSDGPNKCRTPRRSPLPSSPTVAANKTGRRVSTRARTSASPIATSAARPRALSAMPGPSSRGPRRATETSNSGPKTVSRCALRTTQSFPVSRFPHQLRTLPTASIVILSSPASPNISATRAPRAPSAPVGAGIADSAAWRPSVASSERSMCAPRTVIADIEPIVRVANEVGIKIEAATFIGSSPIRQYTEDWTVDRIVAATEEAVTYAVRHGLPVMYVTEDTTRARPETIKALYGAAIECGAGRICLADTVGHATPDGVRALVKFVKKEIVKENDVKIDWHGHRDRGMGLINCLAAIEAGVDRVHATALGVGERVGNAEMDLLIVNLKLLGAHRHDIAKLPEYCRLVADAVGVPIPVNYPVLGADAFRTGTGVHAAAIIKAKRKGHNWLADRVYSSVPAEEVGSEQRIEVSPVSSLSNVKYWLERHGYDPEDDEACRTLFDAAKRTDRVLSDEECHRLLNA